MARFLPQCLGSIARQDYPNLEVIVVDGLSKDDTAEVIGRYSDLVTRFVSEKDRGQPDAVTKGLSMATGDIVHWHAADDIIMPGAFHRVAREMLAHPDVDLVFSDGMAFDDRKVYFGPTVRWEHFETALVYFGRFQSDTAYWRNSITRDALPLDLNKHLTCDEDFFLRLWVGHKFRWVNQPLGAFRVHGDQVSQRVDRNTCGAERQDTRRQVIEKLGWSPADIARIRRRLSLRYCLLNRFIVKAHSATRFILRKLTLDVRRKRLAKWFFNEWLKPAR
ncbi:MAG: glycosyltransferase [Phycisphaerae bacterium]|jgi:glycosyltransferase involved in cell wall biosynthesis